MMNEMFERVKALILAVEPNAAFVEKYGGLIVESAPGHAKSQFCGVFAYTGHMSLEFTHGAQLDNPDGILEGRGKHRRHIKVAEGMGLTSNLLYHPSYCFNLYN